MKKGPAQKAIDENSNLEDLWQEIFQKTIDLSQSYYTYGIKTAEKQMTDDYGIHKAFTSLSEQLLSDPEKLSNSTTQFWEEQLNLWEKWINSDPTVVKKPDIEKVDSRFRSKLWDTWLFDYVRNAYLLTAEHLQKTVNDIDSLDERTARKVKFFTKQYVDAMSPTNFAALNPDVLKATVDSNGGNLLSGLNNLLDDLKKGKGELAIKMVDPNAFELGKDVATTDGKVVYQNELMQLIQYQPTTKSVLETPLLIIPPWINKYYILDLTPRNSFIKWAIDQGHTVFVISWVNPDARHAHKTFDDYLVEGPLAALDVIDKRCKTNTTNLVGYCLGGTLTAVLLGWLKSNKQEKRVNSTTFFTSMIDFNEPGELGVFVDPEGVDALEKRMASKGYLEASEMASTFNMLRSNDLIWSFVVNNYLLGKDPVPFDLLFWNSDATRMPAKMHSYYLRNMYIHNKLREPKGLTIAGRSIDLSTVTTPCYFISAKDDHIAPWKSTFAGAKLFGGKVRFVLGGSGHIAGIVNPPVANKYCFWANDELTHEAESWLQNADRFDGSWWSDWSVWISSQGSRTVNARKIRNNRTKPFEDAPGSYAKLRLDSPQDGQLKSL
ncbi:MAG: class I poly(R)-hydroxyalkanoic acid synthase [Burkholderiales bacterium]|jgi:polyhydroxyalkanoate synthase|nr:class I poly(R)-hydroxyalkanoic acid synthase [Burkholderiales bacterium]MBL6879144.1 class I poly(R)-hydroxyalkanoic acid synthase [Burkholderiales bacterium]